MKFSIHSFSLSFSAKLWLTLFLITDFFFIFIVWLTKPTTFKSVLLLLLLFTFFIISVGIIINQSYKKRLLELLSLFLAEPDSKTEHLLLQATAEDWHPIIQKLSKQLTEQLEEINEKQLELENYQEFIEAWVHEIKTPLSLTTLLLENHRDEMSPYLHQRLSHVRQTIHVDVNRILYYARLQADHIDFVLESLHLEDIIMECLQDFQTTAKEKQIQIRTKLQSLQVISDRKALCFMLSQLLSNAFKYTASENGIVQISVWSDETGDQNIHLSVQDNGSGVPPEDEAFLFDKGFTGNHPKRQNATGMGLYLVKKFAKALSLEVMIESGSTTGNGFGIQLIFPAV